MAGRVRSAARPASRGYHRGRVGRGSAWPGRRGHGSDIAGRRGAPDRSVLAPAVSADPARCPGRGDQRGTLGRGEQAVGVGLAVRIGPPGRRAAPARESRPGPADTGRSRRSRGVDTVLQADLRAAGVQDAATARRAGPVTPASSTVRARCSKAATMPGPLGPAPGRRGRPRAAAGRRAAPRPRPQPSPRAGPPRSPPTPSTAVSSAVVGRRGGRGRCPPGGQRPGRAPRAPPPSARPPAPGTRLARS